MEPKKIMNLFNPTTPAQVFDQIRISIASPGEEFCPGPTGRRSRKPGDHQLPKPFKPGSGGRSVLRPHLSGRSRITSACAASTSG